MEDVKFYRAPWTADLVAELRDGWPHWGTREMSWRLGLKMPQVKSKADKLGLKMLPKGERRCSLCPTGFQSKRQYGLRCHSCHLGLRKRTRREKERTTEQWVAAATNTARMRSKIPSDLTTEYMVALWDSQNGLCAYSGLPMVPPKYGAGRNAYGASIDQITPSAGYVEGNVVWCLWAVNSGKSDLPLGEYVAICNAVSRVSSPCAMLHL